jgi:4-amino-4-deoxy-L-arabinose transferase-like glycosyltransferase
MMTEIAVDRQIGQSVTALRRIVYAVIQHRYFILVCFVAAFIIRVYWIHLIDAQPVSDSRWYYERGVDFAAGRGYSVSANAYWPENLPPAALVPEDEYPMNGMPTAYWPVGYPAFLGLLFAVFGPSLFVARAANIVLYLGIMFLSYSLAKGVFGSELCGRITLLVLTFYPNHIAYSSLLVNESLFVFLLLLAIALLVALNYGLWPAFAAGLVFGLACLVKPQAAFVPAVMFAAYLLTNLRSKALLKRLLPFVIVYISLGLTLLPWIIRNFNVFDDFVFISNNGGINLLVGNNPYATGAYGHHEEIGAMLTDVQGEHDRDVRARKIAVEYITEHPWETIKLWPKKLWYLYRKDVEGFSWNENGIEWTKTSLGKTSMLILKGIAQLYYVLIGTAFLFSVLLLFRKHRDGKSSQPIPTLGLWISLYFTFVYLLTFADTRFHFPVMPWIVMYVGAFVEALMGPRAVG